VDPRTMMIDLADNRAKLEELKRERDNLSIQIRAATKDYDDHYWDCVEQLENAEQQLLSVRNTRDAIHLAKEVFQHLCEDNYAMWALKLTDISRALFRQINSDYESLEFDGDLGIKIRLRGQRHPMGEWQLLNQSSQATREQIYLLARITVLQYLSRPTLLPIILDEPFAAFDDVRFVEMMRFMLTAVVKRNQVILLSSHKQRHSWLIDQITAAEAQNINLCRLEPIKSAPVSGSVAVD
jgi:uncharacterized protein YhaN